VTEASARKLATKRAPRSESLATQSPRKSVKPRRRIKPGKVCWNGVTFCSKFERDFAKQLEDLGYSWSYEPEGFIWLPDPKVYSPDFRILKEDGSYMYIETKGFFDYEARNKMATVRKQYPDMDLRMVFQKPDKKLSKAKSSIPYSTWAERNNYEWSSFCLPTSWREECQKGSTNMQKP